MNSSEPIEATYVSASPFASRVPELWQRVERWLDRGSEWLNPILVKEARQALKSRQFLVTFTLLLICGWVWSFLGLSMLKGGVYFAPSGRFMMSGYYWILAFPMTIIIPFSAFRSLAAEREDGTYELLSITTLRPRQIVLGKLASAVLQTLIYLSALSPCLAFTYLLRGIDILSILVILFWTFMASVLLSALGLLVATLTRAKHWQVVLMVVMILGLAFVYIYGSAIVTVGVVNRTGMPLDDADFWIGQLTVLSAWVGAFGLIVLAASARITFLSDNRSTKLRVWMFVCHGLILGWCVYAGVAWDGDAEAMAVYLILAMGFWWVMGAMMVGERGELSPRVRRSLPQSFVGRVFLTFFQPGPGTGYLFVVSQCLLVAIVVFTSLAVGSQVGGWSPSPYGIDRAVASVTVLFCFVVIYVGVGRLIMRALGRVVPEGPLVALLIGIVLLLFGCIGSYVLQMGLLYDDSYTVLQAPNPFWTTLEALGGDLSMGTGGALFGLDLSLSGAPVVLMEVAMLVFVLNLLLAAPEIVQTRAPVPTRVQEEDQLLHPVAETEAAPSNPWDYPD